MSQHIVHSGSLGMVAASRPLHRTEDLFRPIGDQQPKRSSVHPQGRSGAEEAPQVPCTLRERRLVVGAIVECFDDAAVEPNLKLLGRNVCRGLHVFVSGLGREEELLAEDVELLIAANETDEVIAATGGASK